MGVPFDARISDAAKDVQPSPMIIPEHSFSYIVTVRKVQLSSNYLSCSLPSSKLVSWSVLSVFFAPDLTVLSSGFARMNVTESLYLRLCLESLT